MKVNIKSQIKITKFIMEEVKCIICNKSAEIAIENFNGYKEGEGFNIYYCSYCNTSFIWPHVVDNKIYDYIYSQTDSVPGYNRYALYASEIKSKKNALDYLADKEAMYFAVKEILSQTNDKTIKILEVGSGLGYLTYAITQEGYDITGIDISNNAVKSAESKFGNHFICQDVYEYALDMAGKFDIVILTEVIEHVPDPDSFCNTLISLLKPQGKLIITTPNKSAHSQQEYWYTELPPVHLTWFSEKSFKIISEQKNLSISFFDFTSFNKNNLDITKFKYYDSYKKRNKIIPTLNNKGEVLKPKVLIADNTIGKFKTSLKFFLNGLLIPF